MKHIKTQLISIATGLMCCGTLVSAALPQALAAAEASAPADAARATKVLQTLSSRLAKAGVLDTARAEAIAAAAVEICEGNDGISVSATGGKLRFVVCPSLMTALEKKAGELGLANTKKTAAEWYISAVAGACAEADLLLAVGEEKAAGVPAETRRGLAFCMENSAYNLLGKQQVKLEEFSDAAAPSGDIELAIHMLTGEGSALVNYDEDKHLFTPNYASLTAAAPAPKSAPETPAPSQPEALAEPDKDTCYPISDAFKKAVDALVPLSDPTDVESFKKGLQSLLVHESRALRLTVHEEAQKRSFDSLTAAEASRSKHWYVGPQVSLELSPDWVRYYAGTVVPRLDAFYRSAAKNVETYEPYCVVKRNKGGGSELWYEKTDWINEVRKHGEGYSRFYIATPVHPEELEHARIGSRVQLKVTIYYLPKAFEAPGGRYNTYWQSYDIYGHICDSKGEYIGSIQDKRKWNLNEENNLGWTFLWMMRWAYSEPVLTERQFFLNDNQEFGHCLVSFRNAETCFPDKQKEQEKTQETEKKKPVVSVPIAAASGNYEVSLDADQITAIATNPTVIVLSIFALIFICAFPWMLWTFWAEHRRKLPLLPEPDEATEGTYHMESLELEMLSDIMAPALAWSAEIEITEDENGSTIGVLPSKKMVDTGFAVMHELFRSADKMQPCDRFYYNRLAELLNDSQKRYLSGSSKLVAIIAFAMIGSIAAAYYFSCAWLLLYTAVAFNYGLCLMCPLYKALRPAPLFVRGLRKLLGGMAIFGTLFATNLLDRKYATVYRDNMGNLYHDSDEVNDQNTMGIALMIMVFVAFVLLLPPFMLVDGSCNFLRNYITQK